MTTSGPWRLSLEEGAARLRARELTSVELTQACISRIEALEPALNAFITVTRERALADAARADRERAAGADRGPLHGIPLSLKDLFDVRGVPTTAGGSFPAAPAAADGAVTQRLTQAGAVLLGKTGLHEHAFGVTSANPHFGHVRNPWSADRIPGGSSGGSAAAVATGGGPGSIGSDTGGSIRIPAALCGVVGLKPTRGRVSLRGAVPLSWTLDHAGPLARTVRDAALLYAAVAGHDPLDPGSRDAPARDVMARIEDGVRGMRLAVWRWALDEAEPEVRATVTRAIDLLRAAGAAVEEITLPRVADLKETQRIVLGTDAYAFHAQRVERDPGAYGGDVLERLLRGKANTSAEHAAARRARSEIRVAFDAAVAPYDALLLPTTPVTAPPREGESAVALAARLTALTSPFNLTGLPAVSVPCGIASDGLPVGLQLVGRRWDEDTLLRAARAYEAARGPFPWPAV